MNKTFTVVAVETVEMQPITEFITVRQQSDPEYTRHAAMKKFFRSRAAKDTTAIIDIFEGEIHSVHPQPFAIYHESLRD